jgi:hypothetical protein
MFIGIGIIDFRKQFKTEEDCLKYLVQIKWGNGYKCIKCGHKVIMSITKEGNGSTEDAVYACMTNR